VSVFLTLAYLFFIGSLFGWILELFFRRFISAANPERKWINPGFCTGPYVPLYGFGLCILYLLAASGDRYGMGATAGGRAALFLCMAVSMTAIEYAAGLLALRLMKIRLWDYSGEWANLNGLICPKFSFFWALLGAVYYFGIHQYILDALAWLSENLAFSFVIGFFFGVFTIDVVYSANIVTKLKKFADENDVVVRYENLKAHIRSVRDRQTARVHFLFPFLSEIPIAEHLRARHDLLEVLERLYDRRKKRSRR